MSTLERYARVRAAIERSGDRDRVLEAEGITRAAWTAMQQRWLDALSAEVEGGGTTLAERYFLAFTGARGDAPASDAIEDIAPSPEPIAAPVVISPAAPVAPAMPSQPEPPRIPAQPELPAPRAVPAFAQGTALSFEVPRGPAMPFRTGGPVSPLAAPSGAPPPRVGSGTSLTVDVPRALVTPFAKGATPPAPPPPSPVAAAPIAGPPIAPPAATPPIAPPVAAAPPAIPELNVEQYAWVVATLRRTAPADLPAVLARFRLTPEARHELEERWRARMGADPALQQAFLAALGRHLGRPAG